MNVFCSVAENVINIVANTPWIFAVCQLLLVGGGAKMWIKAVRLQNMYSWPPHYLTVLGFFVFVFFSSYQIEIFSGKKKMVLLAKMEILLCTLNPNSFSKILMKFIRRFTDFVSQEDNYRNNVYGLSSLTQLSL